MSKSGVNMSREEFESAVGRAMRNGDQDANPFVAQSAQAWRSKVFEPFKKESDRTRNAAGRRAGEDRRVVLLARLQ